MSKMARNMLESMDRFTLDDRNRGNDTQRLTAGASKYAIAGRS